MSSYVFSCNCCCECGLCRPAMHWWDVRSCTIAYSVSLGLSAPLNGKCRTAAPHTCNKWLIANMSNWPRPNIICDVMWLMSAQRRMCATVGGALSETVTMVSLRTMPRLFMCQRCIIILVNNETSESELDIGFFWPKNRNMDIGRFTHTVNHNSRFTVNSETP